MPTNTSYQTREFSAQSKATQEDRDHKRKAASSALSKRLAKLAEPEDEASFGMAKRLEKLRAVGRLL